MFRENSKVQFSIVGENRVRTRLSLLLLSVVVQGQEIFEAFHYFDDTFVAKQKADDNVIE